MKAILFVISFVCALLGMLSFLVAVAYWPMKGVGVAGLVGTILVILGALGLLKSFRMFIGSPKKKRERSSYY